MCAHPGSLGLQMVRYQLNCRAALFGIEGTGDIANEVSSYMYTGGREDVAIWNVTATASTRISIARQLVLCSAEVVFEGVTGIRKTA